MDLLSIARHFGVPASDPRIRDLLKGLGIKGVPKLRRGETDVQAERPNNGFWLAFTDEAFFHKKKDVAVGAGPLILTNVTVYCKPTPDFKVYKGELPFGLHATDDHDAIHKKLGKPEIEDKRLRMDRWVIDGLWVFVIYPADYKSIGELSLQLPDA